MFKSIRWTLQVWHAAVLALVLTAFGIGTYYGLARSRYEAIDADLRQWAQALAASFHVPPPSPPSPPGERQMSGGFTAFPMWHGADDGERRPPRSDPFDGEPQPDRPFPERGQPERMSPDWPGPERPGRGERGDRFMPGRRGGRPGDWSNDWSRMMTPQLEIPAALAPQFGDTEAGLAYFVFWSHEGDVLQTSEPPVNAPYPGALPELTFPPPSPGLPFIRQRDDLREAYVNGPFWTRVLVGKSVRREQAELHRLAWLLAAVGGGVLLVGLAGGWLVSQRAVRPIKTITTVAAEISATNLSRRIDTAGTKSELGQLAVVLNDTFARLEAAFQQQVRFTADASHELRTPLAVIHTNAQLALARDRAPAEYRDMFEKCLRASGRMKDLVDSLLLLAGADSGRLSLTRSRFDLRTTAEECVEMVAPLAAKKGLNLETDLHPAQIAADSSRIAQVVTNLLTNAIRYNRENGSVLVRVTTEGPMAVLAVIDTGVGIPAESQAHLFERFYRVDKARSREEGGSGLGLAICRSIVEAHGGTITFESAPGKGTTFTVRLPLAP